jgi:hypothetical protein
MQFMLLMRGDPAAFNTRTEAEQQRVVASHEAWAQQLAEAGKLLRGGGFPGHSVLLSSGPDGVRAKQRDLAGDPQAASGFYLIDVAGQDEATALALHCPALAHGETVEVLHLAF